MKYFEEPTLEILMFTSENIMSESNWGEEDWDEEV